MPRNNPFHHVHCELGSVVSTSLDAEDAVGVPLEAHLLDRLGYTEAAIVLSAINVDVPAGQVASVDIVLETDSDPTLPNPEVMREYVDCPLSCVVLDNTDGTNGDGTGDFSGVTCVVIPLKCVDSSKRYINVKVTPRGGPGVVYTGTAVADYLLSGHPVHEDHCER